MTGNYIMLEFICPQFQVTVFQPQIFQSAVPVGDHKRQWRCFTQQFHGFNNDFYFPCWHIRIYSIFSPRLHFAFDRKDIFHGQFFNRFKITIIVFRIEYDLGFAVAVPEVNKDYLSVQADCIYPAI